MFLLNIQTKLRNLLSRRAKRDRRPTKPRRPVHLRLEYLEDRVTPSTTTTFVDDNWADLSRTSGAPVIGDVLQNNNDTINPGGISAVYGVTGFGTVTTGASGTATGAATIDDAIANTTAGGTVNVLEGTYSEVVTINESLTINGAQHGVNAESGRPGAAESILDATNNSGDTQFVVAADNVTIDGFTIQNQTSSTNFGAAVYLEPSFSGSHIVNNIIQNNVIGLDLVNSSASAQTVVQYNLFQNNNQLGASTGNAIYADQYTAGGPVTNVLIDSNTFINNQSGGVSLDSTDATKGYSDVTISNNNFTTEGNAILLYNASSSTITGNTITASLGSQIALAGGVSDLQISQNFIQNGTTNGIRIIEDTADGVMTPNSNVTVYDNSITGNPTAGLNLDAGAYTGTLDAHDNYWGSASGPQSPGNPNGQGQQVIDPSNQVTVAPWLTLDTDTQPATPGFQGDLTQTASSVAQFATASQTVNATDGSFIVTVTLSAMSNMSTTIPFMISGTAIAGMDYSGVTMSPLVIAAGQMSGTISGTLLSDAGSNKTLVFTLGTPTNATLGATTTDTLTIVEPPAPPPPPAPPSAVVPPPSVSVAFGPNGEVREVVDSQGNWSETDITGTHSMGTGGVRFVGVAFAGDGSKVLLVTLADGSLRLFQGGGFLVLSQGGASSDVQAASVAFVGNTEVLEIVGAGGDLTQFIYTVAPSGNVQSLMLSGYQQLDGGGVSSASVAFDGNTEVLEVVSNAGVLTQTINGNAQQLGGPGVQSAGVAFNNNSEVLDIIFSDGSLDEFDAFGQHMLGQVS